MTGRLDLKVPCKNCPFANRETRITFACRERAEEIEESAYRNGFPCHLSSDFTGDDDEDGGFVFGDKTQHCAGAIGMYLNNGDDAWPGVDNEEPPGDWSQAQAVAFESSGAFIDANTTDRDRGEDND
jgi:hypothetical protein